MPIVRLGNPAAHDRGQPVPGEQVTTIHVPDSDPHDERMRTVTHTDGLWQAVSLGSPTWVESDDPDLAATLAAHYGCPVGAPTQKEADRR